MLTCVILKSGLRSARTVPDLIKPLHAFLMLYTPTAILRPKNNTRRTQPASVFQTSAKNFTPAFVLYPLCCVQGSHPLRRHDIPYLQVTSFHKSPGTHKKSFFPKSGVACISHGGLNVAEPVRLQGEPCEVWITPTVVCLCVSVSGHDLLLLAHGLGFPFVVSKREGVGRYREQRFPCRRLKKILFKRDLFRGWRS